MQSFLSALKSSGRIGLLFIFISFLHLLLPFKLPFLVMGDVLFLLGNILFLNVITENYKGMYLRLKNLPALLLSGFIFALFIELYLHWWGKFWYYPYLSRSSYVLILIPELCLYAVYILATYFVTLSLLRGFLKTKLKTKHNTNGLKTIMPTIGFISAMIFISSTIVLAAGFSKPGLDQFFSINYAPKNSPLLLPIMATAGLSMWLTLEYLVYKRNGQPTLLSTLIRRDYLPFFAILIAGYLSAIIYEGFNAPGGWWRYANVPYATAQLFGVPLLVYALWPVQYLIIIPLYDLPKKNTTTNQIS